MEEKEMTNDQDKGQRAMGEMDTVMYDPLNPLQEISVRVLNEALVLASYSGLLDELCADLHPDAINEFCDAVSARLKK